MVFPTECPIQKIQALEESTNKTRGQKVEKPNSSRRVQGRGWKIKPGDTLKLGRNTLGIFRRNMALE